MKQLCVFDLDGTLVDSIADIADALNCSLKKIGKKEHPVDAYYKMVGNGMEMLCKRALGDGKEAELQALISLYRETYLKNCCVHTVAYPGISEVLTELKNNGMKMAILSNKPQEQTEVVVSTLFEPGTFQAVLGSGPRFPRKPDPAALQYLLKEFDTEPEQVFYVGDSDVDMQLANNVGVTGIGVSWGFRGRMELEKAGAGFVADNAEVLLKYLLKEEEK